MLKSSSSVSSVWLELDVNDNRTWLDTTLDGAVDDA